MGFYQRYEDTRVQTKDELSADIDARPGETSRFPPGVDIASLMAPEDSHDAITTDAFALLEGGTTDISALSAAVQSYSGSFNAEPELSLKDRSQTLGPSQAIAFAAMPPRPGIGLDQVPALDDDCPDPPLLLGSMSGLTGASVSSDCAENEGLHDQRRHEDTLPQPAPSKPDPALTPSDGSVSHRTENGRSEVGAVLDAVVACGKEVITGLWELVTTLLELSGGALAAAWERWGPGWWTDDDADEEFARQIREIRDEILNTARESVELLAALHKYFGDTLETNPIFQALTRALQLVFTPKEWDEMADAGLEAAQEMKKQFDEFLEREGTTYAAVFVACQIGAGLVTGGALVKALRRILNKKRRDEGDHGDHGDQDGDEHSSETEQPEPHSPENITDDPDSEGARTPNGPPRKRDPEGMVRPRWTTPDDPHAEYVPEMPDGRPRHRIPGRYDGKTADDLRRAGKDDNIVAEAESGRDLANSGYDVESLPDGPDSSSPYQPGDYGYDPETPSKKRPDYRINGVIFDHLKGSSPDDMITAINGKLNKGQARNFVVRIPGNSEHSFLDYVQRLQGSSMGPGGNVGRRVAQIIIIDSRSGRVTNWTNPYFKLGGD